MLRINWQEILTKIKKQLESWVPRGLSILGKIQIIKTFGLSQMLYLARVIPPDTDVLKKVKKLFDHFIWSKSLASKKAPSRVKDDILYKARSLGGFGMTQPKDIIESMNAVQVYKSVMINPTLAAITKLISSIYSVVPTVRLLLDPVIVNGLEIIKSIWHSTFDSIGLGTFLPKPIEEYLIYKIITSPKTDVLQTQYLEGIWGFCRREQDMTEIDRQELIAAAKKEFKIILKRDIEFKNCNRVETIYSAQTRTIKRLDRIKSKEIRCMTTQGDMELMPKVGMVMDTIMARKLWKTISSLRSAKIANDILKIIHGDILTNSKLYHQGRLEHANCEVCGAYEDLNHKLFDCYTVNPCWQQLFDKQLLVEAPTLPELIENNHNNPNSIMLISKVAMLCAYSRVQKRDIAAVAVDLLKAMGVILKEL